MRVRICCWRRMRIISSQDFWLAAWLLAIISSNFPMSRALLKPNGCLPSKWKRSASASVIFCGKPLVKSSAGVSLPHAGSEFSPSARNQSNDVPVAWMVLNPIWRMSSFTCARAACFGEDHVSGGVITLDDHQDEGIMEAQVQAVVQC